MKKIAPLIMTVPFLFTGCGAQSEETPVGETQIGGKLTVVTKITDQQALLDEIEARFIEKYPSVEDIIWESAPDYDTYITTRMNTEDYGDVLVIPFTMSSNPQDYEAFFKPLGSVEDLEKEYYDVTEADYNGQVYGLVPTLNRLGIVYNTSVLEAAGINDFPTTTEDFIEMAKQIEERTDAIPFYTDYNRSLGVWGGALTSFGGEQYKSETLKAGSAFSPGQPIREIMDLFYDLASQGLIEEDPVTGDFATGLQLLADGKVAMLMTGSDDLEIIRSMVTNGAEIEIASFPVQRNGQTSVALGAPYVMGINKHTDNDATAKAFLEFLLSKESGFADAMGGFTSKKSDLTEEQQQLFSENNVVLTVPTEKLEDEMLYNKIANEVGVGRLKDTLQQVVNIGQYPEQNMSYEAYIASLDQKWKDAVKANE